MRKFGFEATGEAFIDAGIPHVKMVAKLEGRLDN